MESTRSPNEEIISLIRSDKILAHFGVLGMKWGVRKDRKKSGSGSSRSRSSFRKPLSTMTDDELKTTIQRLQMEQRYAELTKSKKTFGQRITRQALDILGSSTKKAVTKVVDANVEKAVDAALKAIEKQMKNP